MKKMFWIVILGVGCCLKTVGQIADSAGAAAQSLKTMTLVECVQIALKNNQSVYMANFNAETQAVYHSQAKASVFPSVNSTIDHGLNTGRSINPSDNSYLSQSFTSANYNLNASLSLWNGFKVRNYIRKTDLDERSGRLDAQQQEDAITIEVIAAYLDILNQQELLNNLYRQELTTQVQYNRLDTLNQSGAASPADLYDIKGQLNSSEIAIIDQKNAIKTAKITLFQLLNLPLDMGIVLEAPGKSIRPDQPAAGSIDEIYSHSLESLPMIKSSKLKLESAGRQVAINRADYYPSLTLNGGLGTAFSSAANRSVPGDILRQETGAYVLNGAEQQPVYQDVAMMGTQKIPYWDQLKNNYGANVNLTLNIPIFNGLQTKSNVKIARIQEKQAKLELSTTETQLKNAIGKAYFDAGAAMDAWLKQQEQVAAYQEYFRISEVKFNAGAINSSEYLIAKNKLSQAENSLVAAKYNYIFKSKILSYYEGTLSL